MKPSKEIEELEMVQEMDDENLFEVCELYHCLQDITEESVEKVSVLLEKDEVDVTLRGEYEETYLHVTLAPNEVENLPHVLTIMYKLVLAGVEVNGRDREGNTPLHVAVFNELHHSVVNALLKLGADSSLANKDGQVPIQLATDEKTRNVLEYFGGGLWKAVSGGKEDVAKVLVDSWCRINIKHNGKKLITLAEEGENSKITEYLKEKKNTSALVCAALSGNVKETKNILKKEGTDIDTQDWSFLREDGNRTILPLAVETVLFRNYECAKTLVKKGADINVLIETKPDEKQAAYFFLLKRLDSEKHSDLMVALMKKANLDLISNENPYDVIYMGWERKWPSEVVGKLVDAGMSIFLR